MDNGSRVRHEYAYVGRRIVYAGCALVGLSLLYLVGGGISKHADPVPKDNPVASGIHSPVTGGLHTNQTARSTLSRQEVLEARAPAMIARFPGARVLDSDLRTDGDRTILRSWHIRSHFKHRRIRIEEVWESGESAGQLHLRKETAWTADGFLVRLAAGVDEDSARALLTQFGAKEVRPIAEGVLRVVASGYEPRSAEEFQARVESEKRMVEGVSRDYLVFSCATPDDPSFTSQWSLVGGPTGAGIDAPPAWDVRTDASPVPVAVIDSGCRLTHADLAGNLLPAPGEIAANGQDDDGNGFVDDVFGMDFYNEDADPTDDFGHGTHVAGIIGAVGSNGVGIAGVCWSTGLIPIKMLDSSGVGATSDAIRAIDYALMRGARILNMSWGGSEDSIPLRDAIGRANAAGAIVVAAAGNSGQNTDLMPLYPAAFPSPCIISVGATMMNSARWPSSNYGSNSVDVFAPGISIYSLSNGGDAEYMSLTGTSMAAGFVSGAAALLWSRFGDETRDGIIRQIYDTSLYRGELGGICTSGGQLKLGRAMRDEIRLPPRITADPIGASLYVGERLELNVAYQTEEPATIAWCKNGVKLGGSSTGAVLVINAVTAANAGTYRADVTNPRGTAQSQGALVSVTDSKPVVVSGPANVTAMSGADVNFSVDAEGNVPLTYQWYLGATALAGQTGTTLALPAIMTPQAGTYSVRIRNNRGTVTAYATAAVQIVPPQILRAPADQWSLFGQHALFDVRVDSPLPVSYEWRRDGAVIPGATTGQLELQSLTSPDNVGKYTVRVAINQESFSEHSFIVRERQHRLERWRQVHPTPTSSELRDVTYGHVGFVAVGKDATVVSSSDGVDWGLRECAASTNLTSVAAGNGRYVAVGEAGVAMSSPNAMDWSPGQTGITSNITDVAFGDGRFVGVSGRAALVSTNGLTWSSHGIGSAGDATTVSYGNGVFLTTHTDGTFWRSTNGQSWTQASPAIPYAPGFETGKVGFGKGMFWFLAAYRLYRSVDGGSWEREAYVGAGDKPTVFGDRIFYWGGRILRSWDTVARTEKWQQIQGQDGIPAPISLIGGCVGAGKLVIVGGDGLILTSQDGEVFQSRSHLSYDSIWAMAHGDGRYAFFAGVSQLCSSTNGVQWRKHAPTVAGAGAIDSPSRMIWGNGRWVAMGTSKAWISSNLDSWTQVATPMPQPVFASLLNGQYWTVSGTANFRSSDGVTWTGVANDAKSYLHTIYIPEYANGRYWLLTRDEWLSSQDGETWSSGNAPNVIIAAFRHFDQFVGLGGRGYMISPNGQNWEEYSTYGLAMNNYWWQGHLEKIDGAYVAASAAGLYVSLDLQNWVCISNQKFRGLACDGRGDVLAWAEPNVLLKLDTSARLDVEVNGLGTVSGNPGAAQYPYGTEITLSAQPGAGQIFAGWGGDAAGSDTTISVRMTGDRFLVANFLEFNQAWRQRQFTSSEIALGFAEAWADPDGDGRSNIDEYLNATNPRKRDRASVPRLRSAQQGPDDFLEMTFVRTANAPDIDSSVAVSSDMLTWTRDSSFYQAGAAIARGDGTEWVTFRDRIPLKARGGRLFLRLENSLMR